MREIYKVENILLRGHGKALIQSQHPQQLTLNSRTLQTIHPYFTSYIPRLPVYIFHQANTKAPRTINGSPKNLQKAYRLPHPSWPLKPQNRSSTIAVVIAVKPRNTAIMIIVVGVK